MLAAIMIGTFATVSFTMVLLLSVLFKDKLNIQRRIGEFVHRDTTTDNAMTGSFAERVVKPVLKKANSFLEKITPTHYYNQMEKRLKEAGSPKGITVSGVIFFQMSATFTAFAATAVMYTTMDAPLAKVLVILCSLIGLVNVMPKYYFKHKIVERQREIEKSLPDVLDLLTVSIEAGLSFDGAVAKLVEKMSGVLVDEFAIVLKEMRVGVSKRDAFRSLVERVPVPSLVTFVGSIIQADQLGVSIGNVLRIQSSLVRQKRRQKSQENAMKAPIKMLMPMILFIMPTIFIVLLGPLVIKVTQVFGK